MPARFALAKQKAREVLDELGVVEAPVDAEKIARLLGAQVKREDDFDDDFSGMVYRADGNIVIAVNRSHSPKRQRFTLAHEIAHLLLHEDEALHVDGAILGQRDPLASEGTSDKEIEANHFAAHLLMPDHFLARDLRGRHFDIQDDGLVKTLADKYRVSVQAMALRLAAYTRSARF